MGGIVFVATFVICMAASFCITAGLLYLICLCFGWSWWSWQVALGVWLVLVLIKGAFGKVERK